MKCQICGKENASIHIREIKDGEKRSYYICRECAAKQNGGASNIMDLAQIVYKLTSSLSRLQKSDKKDKKDPFTPDMGLPELIELFQEDHTCRQTADPAETQKEQEEKILRCPFCGWGTELFRKTGRVGCPDCYKVFAEILKDSCWKKDLPELHPGKYPENLAPELVQEIENEQKTRRSIREKELLLARMQSDIQSAVVREDYEKAAVLRDQISELEQEIARLVFPVKTEPDGALNHKNRRSSSRSRGVKKSKDSSGTE